MRKHTCTYSGAPCQACMERRQDLAIKDKEIHAICEMQKELARIVSTLEKLKER